MDVERVGLSEWAELLPETGVEPFHDPAALAVLEEHADGELVLLAGYKGQQPVGLLPVVVKRRRVGRAVLSPPPSLGVPRLGPVVMPASPKRRKRERVNRQFTQAALATVDADDRTTLTRIVCNRAYRDPRPYRWAGFDVRTEFTYTVDVGSNDRESLRRSFSKSLRREIDNAEERVTVRTEGVSGARAVYDDTAARYEEQDRQFPLPWPYVRDLVSALDERCRTYVARDDDGTYRGGIVVVRSPDTAYFWLGGARSDDDVSPNSLIHWRVIEDCDDGALGGVTRYDLMGANTERLCRYKAKFGGELIPYYVVESTGASMALAKRAYRLFAR